MAIPKGYRFPIEFDDAFPQGLVMVGEVSPDTEYQSREDKAMGKPARQRVDETTGKRQWKVAVTDPSQTNAKRASYEVTLLADVQPVPTTTEALPGMRPIELEGLTAEPRVAGNGEFKYQSYVFRATGFKTPASSGGRSGQSGKSSGAAAPAESTAKAA
ncbi:hypothetical protein [Qaidamihabitans albus]|uniref:hypothetical protein n=1 Tax=Qaidamihabitans albus TaxID=2795733 RepID=UPI0018F1F010|nr:hypothetical protein [Qaidamihabitans albus]